MKIAFVDLNSSKTNINRHILSLVAMRDIIIAPIQKIDSTLNKIYIELRNYFDKIINVLN